MSSIPGMSLGGIASGLDTNGIIDQLMQVERQPQVRLQLRQKVVQARQSLLKDIETKLTSVRDAATALRSVATWADTQSVSSADSTRVAAKLVAGAGPGGYQVAVTQLARAESHTYSFTASASASTITIGSSTFDVGANATVDDVVSTINGATGSPVYAVNVSGKLVLSSRTTGAASAFSATGSSIVEDTTKKRLGQDAQGTVDSVSFTSASNVVTGVIPGLELTLQGVTTAGAVALTVGTPGPDTAKITDAVKAFANAYNDAVNFVRSRLTEQRVPKPQSDSDALKGLLFGDSMLNGLLGQLRGALSDPVAGNPAGFDQLTEIGLSTGATTGSGTISQSALAGTLQLDAAALSTALTKDPASVRRLFGGDASTDGVVQRLEKLLTPVIQTDGTLDGRVTSADGELRSLKDQISEMDRRLTLRQKQLQAQFTAMETALQSSQSQGQWLSGQLATLPHG
jgi:flagellar hook-associated protein 2